MSSNSATCACLRVSIPLASLGQMQFMLTLAYRAPGTVVALRQAPPSSLRLWTAATPPAATGRSAAFAAALQGSQSPSTAAAAAVRQQSRSMSANPASAAVTAGNATATAPPAPKPLVLVVAVVLLNDQGQVLLAQRPPGKKLAGLWEFPGGKVDPGEAPEAALVRELREELDIAVPPAALQPLTFASHAYDAFHLLMPTYVASQWEGQPRGAEGQALAWVSPDELAAGAYEMPPADIPLLPAVLTAMRRHRQGDAAST